MRIRCVTQQRCAGDVLGEGSHLTTALRHSESLFPHVDLEGYFDSKFDGGAKTRLIDAHEEDLPRRTMEQRVVGHCLGEALDEDDPRNDGTIGEMTQEKRLVGLKGPDSDHPVIAELDDALDEEKRGAMRKDGGDARERAGVIAHGA